MGNYNPELFGRAIAIQRAMNGDSLKNLAKKLDTTVTTLHRYEKGRSTPPVDIALKICKEYLKVPLEAFTLENKESAASTLSRPAIHVFATLMSYLNHLQMTELGVIIKRYGTITNLFDSIKEEEYEETEINLTPDTTQIRKVFNPLTFISPDGLELTLAMRDGGFEIVSENHLIRVLDKEPPQIILIDETHTITQQGVTDA